MEDKIFMREALKEAALAREGGNWAIGCVITLDGKIVTRGRNHVFTKQNRLLHAEIDAIDKLQAIHFDPTGKDFVLYTTLEPCPMCFGAILLTGIRKIVAGTNLDNSGASAYFNQLPDFFQQPHYKTILKTGILERECEEMWLSGIPAQSVMKRGAKIRRTHGENSARMYRTSVRPLEELHSPSAIPTSERATILSSSLGTIQNQSHSILLELE